MPLAVVRQIYLVQARESQSSGPTGGHTGAADGSGKYFRKNSAVAPAPMPGRDYRSMSVQVITDYSDTLFRTRRLQCDPDGWKLHQL
jgi:hypothetical protein